MESVCARLNKRSFVFDYGQMYHFSGEIYQFTKEIYIYSMIY